MDKFVDQFAELSLLLKKRLDVTTPSVKTDADDFCSYCNQKGRRASRCQRNPRRDTLCTICGRSGHSEATFWSKNLRGDDWRGGVARARFESGEEFKMKKRKDDDKVANVQESQKGGSCRREEKCERVGTPETVEAKLYGS